jgi:hypothetical protein
MIRTTENGRFLSCHGRQTAFDRRGPNAAVEFVQQQQATEDRKHGWQRLTSVQEKERK